MKYKFVNKNESSGILSEDDEFTQSLNTMSLSIMGLRSRNEFTNLVRNVTSTWSIPEENNYSGYLNNIFLKMEELGINLDYEISMVKTSGVESMGMPYTRGNSIVITESVIRLESSGAKMPNISLGMGLLAHEVFHILSRNNIELRKELYSLFNFRQSKTGTIENNLVNPDAPNLDYVVDVSYKGDKVEARPGLFLTGMTQSAMQEADKLLLINNKLVNRSETDYLMRVSALHDVSSYHPEEIAAEYFRDLIENGVSHKTEEFLKLLQKFV